MQKLLLPIALFSGLAAFGQALPAPQPQDPIQKPQPVGYRGIWYSSNPLPNEYEYKISGGLGTHPATMMPMAHYVKEANKTFFCWGGTIKGKNRVQTTIGYYDHATGLVPQPKLVQDMNTEDAHDTPTMTIDDKGYIWIFSNAHGMMRPAYVHKSKKPYSIDEFEQVLKTNFSYLQPWYIQNAGFMLLHTLYAPGRFIYWVNSDDGAVWLDRKCLARIGMGHYSVSWQQGNRVGIMFSYHPSPPPGVNGASGDLSEEYGLNARTNVYYLETKDAGKTWTTAKGETVQTPLTQAQNPALVHDYQKDGMKIYVMDVAFDTDGRPTLLYIATKSWEPGPNAGPRTWTTAHWNGASWDIRPVTTSDHNYDFGQLYTEPDGTWRIIGPTDPGAQPWGTGGDVALWTSRDKGKNWEKIKQLTHDTQRNHSFLRKPTNAHPDFYAFWTNGNALQPSDSHVYFTNKTGDHVWKLPATMTTKTAKPEIAW